MSIILVLVCSSHSTTAHADREVTEILFNDDQTSGDTTLLSDSAFRRKERKDRDADGLRRLLLGSLGGTTAEMETVQNAGMVFFNDPEGICLYGRRPSQWYSEGFRVPGRTLIEACVDPTAERIARAARDTLTADETPELIVDLFAGSGNLMLHMGQAFQRPVLGIEKDRNVAQLTARNLSLHGTSPSCLRHTDWVHYFTAPCPVQGPCLFVVAPPWQGAFSFERGLDLRRTNPPVLAVLDTIAARSEASRNVAVVQTPLHSDVDAESLRELEAHHRVLHAQPGCLIIDVLGRAPDRHPGAGGEAVLPAMPGPRPRSAS